MIKNCEIGDKVYEVTPFGKVPITEFEVVRIEIIQTEKKTYKKFHRKWNSSYCDLCTSEDEVFFTDYGAAIVYLKNFYQDIVRSELLKLKERNKADLELNLNTTDNEEDNERS